ncbi:MAG: translocation/assembly module TamB domain-containing protein [Vicinamibacterales bacterium]|nr:translocation/assembly module TamB domain-containing protein [Vicinamibacterales bacterium]
MSRRVATGAAVALALLAALAVGVHLPAVQSRVVVSGLGWLRSNAGIDVTVEEASYNLVTQKVRARGVRASVVGSAAPPFALADEVLLDLSPNTLWGRVRFQSIEVTGLKIAVVRDADGSLNLPQSRQSTQGGGLSSLPIERLSIRDADISYQDLSSDWGVAISGFRLDLAPGADGRSSGRVMTARGPSIRVGEREGGSSTLDGAVSYDGTSVFFEPVRYNASEARLQIDGRLTSLWSAPSFDLRVSGDLALSPASPILKIDPPARGTIALQAMVAGPLSTPLVSVSLDSDGVSWQHIGPASLAMRSTVSSSAISIDRALVTLDGGSLTGQGRIAFDRDDFDGRLRWEGIPAASILGEPAKVALAGRMSGAAVLQGNMARGWPTLSVVADNVSSASAVTGDQVSLRGKAHLSIGDGRWQLNHSHVFGEAVEVAGDSSGALSDSSFGQSALGGSLAVSASDLSKAGPLLAGFGLAPPASARPQAGYLDARFRVGGTIGSPSLEGDAAIHDLKLGEIGPINLTSDIGLDVAGISLDGLSVAAGNNHVVGSGGLDFRDDALRGSLGVELSDMQEVAPALTKKWRPWGALSGQFDIGGLSSKPSVHGVVRGEGLAIGTQPLGRLSAAVNFENGQLAIRQLELQQPEGGRLTLDAEYALATRAYAARVNAQTIFIEPIGDGPEKIDVSAVLDGAFDGRGTLEHPGGSGRFQFTGLRWEETPIGSATLAIALSDAGARLNATVPDFSTVIDATVQLQSPYTFIARADAQEMDVARLSRLQGRLSARLSATGTLSDLSDASAEVDLQNVELRTGDATLGLTNPTVLRYVDRTLEVGRLRLRTGSSTIEISGRIGRAGTAGSLEATIQGELADVNPWLPLISNRRDLALGGVIDAKLTATGSLERPVFAGSVGVTQGNISIAEYPNVSQVTIRADVGGNLINVTRVEAQWQGATLEGRSRIPLRWLSDRFPADLSTASLSGRINGITPAAITPFAGESIADTIDGRTSLAFDLQADTASLDDVRGTLTLDELSASASGVPVTQVRPTQLAVSAGRVMVADWVWEVAGSRLSVLGQATLTGAQDLDLRATGRIDLRVIGAFLPQMATAGTGDLSLNITGTLSKPIANGSIDLRSGELRLADPQIALSDLNGRVQFVAERLRLEDLTGRLNGGRVTATGDVGYEGWSLTDGGLTLLGSGVALDVPEGVRSQVDPDLTLSFARDRMRLSGQVTVQRGAYREPLSLAARFASAARQRSVGTAGTEPSLLDRLDVDVAIVSNDDLLVDNNYGRMDLGLDLRLVGTPERPSVVGRATIREGGVLYLGSRTYQIESGVIDFTNPREVVPDIDLTARTRIAGYDVTLTVAGTPETVRATLTSDPSLAQSDIVSLLATGRVTDQVGGAGTQVASEQLLGYLSGETLGFAAHAIGLDTLRLERGAGLDDLQSDPSLIAGEADPSSRLTVSKTFSRYAEVVLSQNLREGGQLTWIGTYTPRSNVELRAVSQDDRSRSYEVRHGLSFGGPPSTAGAGTTKDVQANRDEVVAEVRFTGSPVFTPQELRGALRLTAGDRFDFYRWQQDRERLRQFYLDRGYFEARVSARHDDRDDVPGSPRIVLDYEIERGPLTTFEISGHGLRRTVIDQLEDVWSNAVFDEALFADLERTVRRQMFEEGFLRARVGASRAGSTTVDEKRVRIVIEPGERTSSRQIIFEGNGEISDERLRALLESLSKDVDPWLEPARLPRDVTALYRAEGFLAAKVTASPPEFEGDRATLRIRIDEGPAFTISHVVLEGVHARSEDEVRRSFGLEPGSRYVPREIDERRRAVDADYASLGFNKMRSIVDSLVDLAGATLQLTLNVDEGRQQILDSVSVDGAAGLRPDVTVDTLRLEPESVVDMTTWYQARRRLLDTGLFRRVDIEAVPTAQAGAAPGTERVQAKVSVERRPAWQLRYGVMLTDEVAPASESREFGGGLSADVQRRGILGRPGTVGGAFRLERDQRIGRVFFTLPSLFGFAMPTNLFASRSRQRIEESGFLSIVTDKTTFTFEQRTRPISRLQVSYGYQFERNHTFDPNRDPDDPLALDLSVRAARLTSTAVFDTRNDPFDARRGLFHSSNIEFAPKKLGSDVKFVKYFMQQFLHVPLAGSLISASAFRLGLAQGFGQDLLPSERFFAGGVNTIRGYPENSLGPQFLDVANGGEAELILNQEIRFPIFRWLRGVAFVDAGNVFGTISEVSLTGLVVGTGVGLRFATPVGLFRLDVGVPTSEGDRRGNPRLHFSFGQMF